MQIRVRRPSSIEWNTLNRRGFIKEEELRSLIEQSPSIISPYDEESELSNFVISLIEFPVPGVGNIDVLAFSPNGDIAIVECKLARNPEHRRQVIGQVLDYATHLQDLSYEEVDRVASQRHGANLEELISNIMGEGWSPEDFIENVRKNLRDGSFSLVIAVDRIDDSLRRLVEYVNQHAEGYSLYALEVGVYESSEMEILVTNLYGLTRKRKETEITFEFFIKVMQNNCPKEVVNTFLDLYQWVKSEGLTQYGWKVSFGRGKQYPSAGFKLYMPSLGLSSKSIFTIWAKAGSLSINYGWIADDLRRIRTDISVNSILREFHSRHGLSIPEDFTKYPTVRIADELVRKESIQRFKDAILWLAEKFRTL